MRLITYLVLVTCLNVSHIAVVIASDKNSSVNSSIQETSAAPENNRFLTHHWQVPFFALKASSAPAEQSIHPLSAKKCQQCHQKTYNDWQKSYHANSMGVGVIGQLKNYHAKNTLTKESGNPIVSAKCLACHAPLTEQAESLNLTLTKQEGGLHQEGITCVACHQRDGVIFSSNNSTKLNKVRLSQTPHLKIVQHQSFSEAKICAGCHQFPQDGIRLEGKLLQNTFNEWQESRFAQEGIACQRCHMPAQRHLWQGIHSKAMVLRGLTIDQQFTIKNTNIEAVLAITNTGVGHYFPTYVTPRVLLEAFQLDGDGEIIKGSDKLYELMRAVSLDLQDEYFDSRLAPEERIDFVYQKSINARAKTFVFRITVEPDYFYQHFYRASIDAEPESMGAKDLEQAVLNSHASSYLLFQRSYQLN